MTGTQTVVERLALARLAARGFRDRRNDEAQRYIVEACRKSGTTYGDSCGHFGAIFHQTRLGKSLQKRLRKLEAVVKRLEDAEIKKIDKTNAKLKAVADKTKAREDLAAFNKSISHLRCYTWNSRRQSAWGNVRTVYYIDVHGIEMVRGKFRPTQRRLSATTTYHNEVEARSSHESKGDLFFWSNTENFSDSQIVTQMARKKPESSLTPNDVEYWKRESDVAHKSATKYAHLVEIIQRPFHAQNRYARWLKSVAACNSGIADAVSGFDNSPYDTVINGNEFHKSWLARHSVDGVFPGWDSFE